MERLAVAAHWAACAAVASAILLPLAAGILYGDGAELAGISAAITGAFLAASVAERLRAFV